MPYEEGVSVIVPIYNAEEYLKTCLNSIVRQSYKNLEIICVLDAKFDDNSEKILKNFARDDKRIKIINDTTGKGVGYNRNLGIEHATKEYTGFVDADDYIDKDFYERLYDFAKIFDTDVVQGDMVITNSETNEVLNESKCDFRFEYNIGKIFASLKNSSCCDKIYRTSVIKDNADIRFSEETIFESIIFLLKVLIKCNKYMTTPGSFYHWVKNPDSVFSDENIKYKSIDDGNTVLKLVCETLARLNTNKSENSKIIRFMLDNFATDVIKDPRYGSILVKQIERLIK